MPDFVKKLGTDRTPFGRNEFLRSTDGMKTFAVTIAKESVPAQTIDGNPDQKILQPGTVIAKITSGPNAGKFGPFQAAGTAEVQTLTKSGTWTSTGGTYKVGVTGSTDSLPTVPFDTTGTALADMLDALDVFEDFTVTGSGGAVGTTPIVITITGNDVDADVPALTFDATNITGGTSPNAAWVTGTAGLPGASDGRQTAANIVGLALTFLPWQLEERDVEIGVVYEATVVQGWCIEYNAAGVPVPLSNTTAAYLQRGGAAGKSCDIGFF